MQQRIINTWTTRQLARMEELIKEAQDLQVRVDWREHLVELGHSLHAVRTMASTIHKRRYQEKQRGELNLLRALADGLDAGPPKVGRPRKIEPPAVPTPAETFSHGPITSLSRLVFAAELRDRVAAQGITAAQFGDPLPGRSALDRKRAGILDPPARPDHRVHRAADWNRIMWKRQHIRDDAQASTPDPQ